MAELQIVGLRAIRKERQARDIAMHQVGQIVKDVWQKVYNAVYELYNYAAKWLLKSYIPKKGHMARFLLCYLNATFPTTSGYDGKNGVAGCIMKVRMSGDLAALDGPDSGILYFCLFPKST